MAEEDFTQYQIDTPDESADESELSPLEEKALSMGWKPAEEFEGNPDDWRSAKEFIDRDSLYKKIHNQSREIRKTQEAMQALIDHNKKLTQSQREDKATQLQSSKLQAMEEGDYSSASQIDEQIAALSAAEDDLPSIDIEPVAEETPNFVAFKDRNPWYTSDNEMTAVADALANSYVQSKQIAGQSYSEQDVFDHVEATMPKRFPEHFTPRRSQSSLGSNTRTTPKQSDDGGRHTYASLNAQQKQICDTFVNSGVMTRKDYVKQLAEMGEI